MGARAKVRVLEGLHVRVPVAPIKCKKHMHRRWSELLTCGRGGTFAFLLLCRFFCTAAPESQRTPGAAGSALGCKRVGIPRIDTAFKLGTGLGRTLVLRTPPILAPSIMM